MTLRGTLTSQLILCWIGKALYLKVGHDITTKLWVLGSICETLLQLGILLPKHVTWRHSHDM